MNDKVIITWLTIIILLLALNQFRMGLEESKNPNPTLYNKLLKSMRETEERCDMCNVDKSYFGTRLDGIYRNNSFYCVWTGGEDTCDILDVDPNLDCVNQTLIHELAHYFVSQDKQHFCKPEAK